MDYDETFSPVVKPATIRVVLSLATGSSWPIYQLDVMNAFLHGHLAEMVYSTLPAGFIDSSRPWDVCRLNRSLYGLKQAPRAWFLRFANFLATLGFTAMRSASSLFLLASSLLRSSSATAAAVAPLVFINPAAASP